MPFPQQAPPGAGPCPDDQDRTSGTRYFMEENSNVPLGSLLLTHSRLPLERNIEASRRICEFEHDENCD